MGFSRVVSGNVLQIVSSGLQETARWKMHVSSCKELISSLICATSKDQILVKFPTPSVLVGACIQGWWALQNQKTSDQGTALCPWGQLDVAWINTSFLRCKGKEFFPLPQKPIYWEVNCLLGKGPSLYVTGGKKKKKAFIMNVNTWHLTGHLCVCE